MADEYNGQSDPSKLQFEKLRKTRPMVSGLIWFDVIVQLSARAQNLKFLSVIKAGLGLLLQFYLSMDKANNHGQEKLQPGSILVSCGNKYYFSL